MKHNIIRVLKAPQNLLSKVKKRSRKKGMTPLSSNGTRSRDACAREDRVADIQDALSEDSIDGSGTDDNISYGSIELHDDLSITHHRHVRLEL